jgi:hypothetical protein
LLLILLLVAAALVDWLSEPHPMSDSHWDASIYLLRAHHYANGDTLGAFRAGALEIHDAVVRGVYPTPYWSFMRVGQTILMGTVVGVTGSTDTSIHVLTWLYRGLLALGLFLAAMASVSLVRVFRQDLPESRLYAGALLSLALYLLADIGFYMNGHLMSEVPAIALIAVSAWALVKSLETGSRSFAILSGVAAFALYVVRMESVWAYVALLGAAALTVAGGWRPQSQAHGSARASAQESGWSALAVSAITAAVLFGVYSWFFFPLTDPRLAVHFSEATAKFAMARHAHLADGAFARIAKQMLAANGLLWVGAILGLPLLRTSRAYRFGFAWLLLSLVPAAVALTHATTTQTRVFTTMTPTLVVLSTLGWAEFLSGFARGRHRVAAVLLAGTCVLLLLISQPATYSTLRALPGMWRLQYAREFLSPMAYERVDFRLPELVTLERAIARAGSDTLVVASPEMQAADHIMVLQYLYGSRRRAGGDPERQGAVGRADGADALQVRLSTTLEQDEAFLGALPEGRRVLLVAMTRERDWMAQFACCGVLREPLATPNFTLVELARGRRVAAGRGTDDG